MEVALGKTVFQSLKPLLVVNKMAYAFVAVVDDFKEQVGGVRVIGQVTDLVMKRSEGRA